MSQVENRERYDPIAQTFHWLTVALVLAAYVLSEGGPESRVYSTEVEGARRIHETLGLLVFAVVVLRLVCLRKLVGRSSGHPPGLRYRSAGQ